MANTTFKPFHSYTDRSASIYMDSRPDPVRIFSIHRSLLTRTLNYRFYSHFHPYVNELDKRLIEGSVHGLQSIDTEWGTPAKLVDGKVAELPGGKLEPIALAAGEIILIQDGTEIRLLDGTRVKYQANLLIRQDTGSSVIFPDNALVILPGRTRVKRANGTFVVVTDSAKIKLLSAKPRLTLYEEFFQTRYSPNPELVDERYPVKELDFTSSGAYSVYNWELFFHAPFTIAVHLSKNQRFAEAMSWFHYIFDPTDDSDGSTPERFWKVKPFQYTDVKKIEDILVNLSSGGDSELMQDTINCINAWKDAPFRPHLVARYRQSAYMFKTVMAYLDNLIDWGDSLFRQDTGESIDEAMQLYVLAANILGPRPQAVPKKGTVRPQTYANLKKDLKAFGTVLVNFETDGLFELTPHPNNASGQDQFTTLRSIGQALYFCVPRNDKLLSYWDTVADRLFKIRNSLNIQGIFRQLPLFEPPIDPALLARATASGLNVGAVLSGINQPLPLVRFQLLVQKAGEICQEVKSLGNNILSAIEKEDNEAMAVLRARHESVILGMAEVVKFGQWQEAIKAREGLERSFVNAIQRFTYYERLLGVKDEDVKKKIPELVPLDAKELEAMKKELRLSEPEVNYVQLRLISLKTSVHLAVKLSVATRRKSWTNWRWRMVFGKASRLPKFTLVARKSSLTARSRYTFGGLAEIFRYLEEKDIGYRITRS